MRKPGGYSIRTDPDPPKGEAYQQEWDTFTCGHCCQVVFVKPQQRPEDLGGFCTCCTKLICSACVGKGCDPLEKKLERWESRRRLFECL